MAEYLASKSKETFSTLLSAISSGSRLERALLILLLSSREDSNETT